MISKCYLVEPFVCNESDSLKDVASKLKKFNQRHIYVVKNNAPVGIISITDILEKIIIKGQNPVDVKAKDIMTTQILVFDDNEDVKKAYKEMTDKSVISCAVIDKKKSGKMVGILTLKEALRFLTDPKNIV